MGKKKVTNISFSYSGRSITATWAFNETKYPKRDYYSVTWRYYNPDAGQWSDPVTSKPTSKMSTITLGAAYSQAKISIKPVQKKKRGKAKAWTGEKASATSKVIGTQEALPDKPNTPTVEITGTTLKAYIENYKSDGAIIYFYIVKDNSIETVQTAPVNYSMAMIDNVAVEPGSYYKVRCRAVKNNLWSEEYSDYSSNVPTAPGRVPGIPECEAMAVDPEENVMRARIKWQPAVCVGGDPSKDSYEIEYTTKVEYFDRSPDDVQSVEHRENFGDLVHYIPIQNAGTYFFRVRGVNASGKGGWSETAEITIGLKPEAPTTWSYSTSVAIGDDIIFNWTHNSADGSKQREAQITVTITSAENQETEPVELPPIPISGDQKYYVYSTAGLTDGTKIEWKVRTKGVFNEYSDDSVVRTIYIYQRPSVTIDLHLQPLIEPRQPGETEEEYLARSNIVSEGAGKITAYPLVVDISSGPDSQSLLVADFSITANESYTTEDDTGLTKYVAKGEAIFTRRFDNPGSNNISFELDPGEVALETATDYIASVTVSMSSGLEASYQIIFYVDYEDDPFDPDAEIYVDRERLTASIRPYCLDEYGAEIRGGAVLRVYRRNYDGTFTLIQANDSVPADVTAGQAISLTDPHPALDYARYRVVARSTKTGQISYYDVPGEPVNNKSIVINWEEEWRPLDGFEGEAIEDLPLAHSASRLILPYNVDVSENNSQDVALIEYIGRSHPVSYYGTQKGYSASWKCEIPKDDAETLFALRRLARYAGDVYVREPSGAGYWAFVKVSYNVDHNKVSVPVTFDITRVEGGM